ncbi:MAG: hypothetical protein ACYCQJ_10015 [Nitrososphaerales archaeon]
MPKAQDNSEQSKLKTSSKVKGPFFVLLGIAFLIASYISAVEIVNWMVWSYLGVGIFLIAGITWIALGTLQLLGRYVIR